MRLRVVWVCLSLWVAGVFGSAAAGPFQTMYLWYGYSMEILAFGHDSTGSSGAIAAGCKGTVIDGSCYLDEFLKHIQKVGANSAAWTGMIPGVGPNMFPDVFDTAAELSSSTYSNNHDAQKLFPHAGLSHSPAFSAVYQLVTDRIQLCRQQLGDGELRQELNGIRQAMIMVHDTRVADHAKTCIDGVNDMLDQKGIKWKVIPENVPLQNGGSYDKVDTQKTIDAHSSESQTLLDAVKNYVAGFDTSTRKEKSHAAAIQFCKDILVRVLGSSSC